MDLASDAKKKYLFIQVSFLFILVFGSRAGKVWAAQRSSAVGVKKETKCCEEATSHDIIVFVERPRRACQTRLLISSPSRSNHSPNL